MTIDWELNNDPNSPEFGDLVYGDYQDHRVEGINTLVQRLRIRLSVFIGEWFLDVNRGVPYFQEILEKGTSYDQVSDAIKLVIAQTPEIDKITSFSLKDDELQNRKVIISFTAESIFSLVEVEELELQI
jgi:hypothetical protein